MSVSVDNFLKAIYFTCKETNGMVTGTLLSSRLNISAAAVTGMARKLTERGLVEYTPYSSINLTVAGEVAALKIIRKHRLWESFLYQTLGMDLKEVHDEAERLEHHASENLINSIEKFLCNPKFDPHGEPIPDRNGIIAELKESCELANALSGETYIIQSIVVQESEAFDIFNHYQIKPGTRVKITNRFAFDGSIEIEINTARILLPATLAKKITITPATV